MDFKTRLKTYRINKGFNSKRDFAKMLGVNENSYYMFENGSRTPSKSFLAKLCLYSNRPEEYWLYGAKNEKDICDSREDFKMLHCLMEEIKKEYVKTGVLTDTQKQLISLAFEADMKHLIKKEQGL